MAGNSLGRLTLDLVARIGQFVEPLNRAEQQTRQTSRRIQQDMLGISDGVKSMLGSFAGIAAIYSAMDAADKFTGLRNKLVLVTHSQNELNAAMQMSFDIAQRTGSTWDGVSTIYQRFAQNADRLGLSQQKVADITETVSKALAMSGGSIESQNAAIMQFGQGLGSGVLRGEEFNSVMEGGLGLAQALATGLNVPLGKLRGMAEQGLLTADVIVDAMGKAAKTVGDDFNKTTTTVGQGFQKIRDSYVKFIGESNGGAAAALAGALGGVAKNMELIGNTGAALAVGYVTKSLSAMAIAATQSVTTTWASIQADEVAIAQRIRRAQQEYNVAQAEMSKARAAVLGAEMQVTADRAVIASEINRLKSTQSLLVSERALEVQRLRAQISDIGRTASLNRLAGIQQTSVVITRELQAAEAQLAATTTASSAAYATARNTQTIATERLAAANLELGLAQRATAASSFGLMAALGGPAGLIGILAIVGAGMYLFSDSSDEVTKSLASQADSVSNLAEEYKKLNLTKTIAEQKSLRDEIIKSREDISKANNVLREYGQFLDGKKAEEYRKIVDAVRAGLDTQVAAAKLIGAGFDQSLVDAFAEQANVIELNNNTIIGNTAALDLLKTQQKDQVKLTKTQSMEIDRQSLAVQALTNGFNNLKNGFIGTLQYQLEYAKANGASNAQLKTLTETIDKYSKNAISASEAATVFGISTEGQAAKTDTARKATVEALAKLKDLSAGQKNAANAADGHTQQLDKNASAARNAATAYSKYMESLSVTLNKNVVDNTLLNYKSLTENQRKALADVVAGFKFDSSQLKTPDGQKAIEAAMKLAKVQDDMAAKQKAITDAEKKATDEKEKQVKLQEKLVKLSDLRLKPGATGGGSVHQGTLQAAKFVQDNFDVRQFTALNDSYHKGRSSQHNQGLAFDFTLNNVSDSKQTVDALSKSLKDAGINAQILDEYLYPSKGATGGHIHVAFKTADDAQKFVTASMGKRGEKFLDDSIKANESYFKQLNVISTQYQTDRERSQREHDNHVLEIEAAFYDSPELKQKIIDKEKFRYDAEIAGIEQRSLESKLEFDRYILTEEQNINRELEIRKKGIDARLDLTREEKEQAKAIATKSAQDDIKYSRLQNEQRLLDTKAYYSETTDYMRERYTLERDEIALTQGKSDEYRAKLLAASSANFLRGDSKLGAEKLPGTPYASPRSGVPGQQDDLIDQRDKSLFELSERLRIIQEKEAENSAARLAAEREFEEQKLAINQEYALKRANLDELLNKEKLGIYSEGFGNLTVLTKSKNKELFALGKAAAVAQATVQGFVAIQNALAIQPYPLGLALAATAAVVTAANVAEITGVGFMSGGYTGNAATNAVAGVVHGQEYVFDAQSTKSIGVENLEAIRQGKLSRTMAQAQKIGQSNNVAVNIENYGTSKQFEVQQLSEKEVRVICRDEAPRAVAGDMANANSVTSKAMKNNYQVQRNR